MPLPTPPPDAPPAETAPAAPVRVPAQLLAQVTPEYPAEALPEQLTGEVAAIVTVGPDGVVTDAVYASGGPEVFVAPTLAAARALRFSPATKDGVPVATRLSVRFAFAPPPDAPEAHDPPPEDTAADGAGFAEVVVTARRSVAARETHAVTTLTIDDLERAGGDDLGETISQVPGVAVARGNADSTKPIIRGQQERRLLVLFDGVRHESQKWGLDHATEIDPFAAGEISVIKGAAGVRYGPDAIGGVVLVEPPPLRVTPGVGGKVQLIGVSNGLRGVAAARVDAAPAAVPGLAFRAEGSFSRGAALSTPTYVLGNTGSAEWNAGATVGYTRGDVQLTASYHHFDLKGGVCYCVQSGSPDAFLSQLDLDAPIGSENWTTTYTIDRPYQAVQHDTATARAVFNLAGGGEAKVTYAFQSNHREEYEQARASVVGPQYDFTLRTHSLDATLTHGEVKVGAWGGLEGGVGVAGTFQENVYSGLPLIPNFRALQGGVFGFERLDLGPVAVEAGARYDHLSRTAWLTTSAFERALSRDSLTEADCTRQDSGVACPAAYDAASASLGAVWHAVPQLLDARLDLSRASRFPNADELYMNGSAPTYPVYALGDPGLGVETTWGASPTLGLRSRWVDAEVSGYFNQIDDYVYFAPELAEDGTPAVDVTIQGAFPRFTYRPIDARFYGVDGGFTLLPEALVHLRAQGAVVRGENAETGDSLVMVPPDRLSGTVVVAPPDLGRLHDISVELGGEYVFRQTHVDPTADIAPPPDAYFLLDAALSVAVPFGERTLKIGVEGKNLLNTRYREYTSLLRYYADEPGREVRLRLGLDF